MWLDVRLVPWLKLATVDRSHLVLVDQWTAIFLKPPVAGLAGYGLDSIFQRCFACRCYNKCSGRLSATGRCLGPHNAATPSAITWLIGWRTLPNTLTRLFWMLIISMDSRSILIRIDVISWAKIIVSSEHLVEICLSHIFCWKSPAVASLLWN